MTHHFAPAWFLPGGHLQTMWGRVGRPRRLVELQRESLTTPDGDELLLDHLEAAPGNENAPRFILLHGLEGSSYSVYIQGMLKQIHLRGYPATAVNFRSCARDPQNILRMIPNRRPRLYHSGETTDLEFVVRTLRSRRPDAPLLAFGASLGGNVLLKWLGENPGQKEISAAATLSVPYDLGAGARFLESGMGRFYVATFLRTLKRKAASLITEFPELRDRMDLARIRRTSTFYDFDDAATATLHHFTGADDYYARSSSIRYVDSITTPTLAVSAHDDPFLPRNVLEELQSRISSAVELRITEAGGHVGFVSGRHPWACTYWAEEQIVRWLLSSDELRTMK